MVLVGDGHHEPISTPDLDGQDQIDAQGDHALGRLAHQIQHVGDDLRLDLHRRAQLEADGLCLVGLQPVVQRVEVGRLHHPVVVVDNIAVQIRMVRVQLDCPHLHQLGQRVGDEEVHEDAVAPQIVQGDDVCGHSRKELHRQHGEVHVHHQILRDRLHKLRAGAHVPNANRQRQGALAREHDAFLLAHVSGDEALHGVLVFLRRPQHNRRPVRVVSRRHTHGSRDLHNGQDDGVHIPLAVRERNVHLKIFLHDQGADCWVEDVRGGGHRGLFRVSLDPEQLR
mmetsp:Transcript_91029/g.262411  ORF Transcript_91029/g.262411 Transcript_91029/m.262411 type:complete len:282 (+) Transcript_91029:384-1229(+)